NDDRIDVLAEQCILPREQVEVRHFGCRLVVEVAKKALQPDIVEEEGIFAGASKHRDRTTPVVCNDRWLRCRSCSSLRSEPLDGETIRESRGVGLAWRIRRGTRGIVAKGREDEIDRRLRMFIADVARRCSEIEAIYRVRLEVICGAKAWVRYGLDAHHDDEIWAGAIR